MALDASSQTQPFQRFGRQARVIETPVLDAAALENSKPEIAKFIRGFQQQPASDIVDLSPSTTKQAEAPKPEMLRKFHLTKENYRQKSASTSLLKSLEEKLQGLIRRI